MPNPLWSATEADRENIKVGDPWIHVPKGKTPKLVPEFTFKVIGIFPNAIHLKSNWEGYREVYLSDFQAYDTKGIFLPLTPERMWSLQEGPALNSSREAAEKVLQDKSSSLTEGQWNALQALLETF